MEVLHKIKRLHHLKLVAVLIGLNILDVILTQIGINNGTYESNLVMRYFLGQFGAGAWIIKIGWVTAIVLIALWVGSGHQRALKIAFIVSIVLVSIICLRNGIILIKVI